MQDRTLFRDLTATGLLLVASALYASAQTNIYLHTMDGGAGTSTGGIYAASTDEELRQIAGVASSTGIILDPVYTGKAFRGMMTELEKNPSRFRGRKILFVHTGGMLGLYEKIPQFASILS